MSKKRSTATIEQAERVLTESKGVPGTTSKGLPATSTDKTRLLPSDDAHPPAPRHVRPVDLARLKNVRLELEYVYQQMDTGALQDREAKARCYVLSTIYQVLASGLEKRVEMMEKALRVRGFELPSTEGVEA